MHRVRVWDRWSDTFDDPGRLKVIRIRFQGKAVSIAHRLLRITFIAQILAACATTASFSEEKPTPTIDMKRPYDIEAFKHYNHAVELHQAGFDREAEVEYKAAVKADSRMEEAWCNLGWIYVAHEEYSNAIEALEKALALVPNRSNTLNAYGCALLGLDRIDEAIDKFKAAVRCDPSSKIARDNLVRALKRRNQFEGYRTTHTAR